MTTMKVDPATVATGFRSSKVVGSSVVNEANETVGIVDDLIVTSSEKAPYTVITVGGFLWLGHQIRRCAVPYEGQEIVLPDATKDALMALPKFSWHALCPWLG